MRSSKPTARKLSSPPTRRTQGFAPYASDPHTQPSPPALSTARLRAFGLASVCVAALMVSGCVTRPIVYADSSSCPDLVPAGWSQPTPGADLPAEATVAAWEKFGDAQTAQLDKANGEKVEGMGIVRRCYARDAAAIAKASKTKIF